MAESSCGLCKVVSALCECECTGLQLCISCILPHISTPGNHTMKPISPTPSSIPASQTVPETCSLCLSAPPGLVCACESPGVVLCTKCISLHMSKTLEKEHMMMPLKAWPFVGRPGYVDRLKLRQNSLKVSISNVIKAISLIESCKSDLKSRVEDFIRLATDYRNAKTEKLTCYANFLQSHLERVNREIAENIYDEDYMPLSAYATAVWTSNRNQEDLFWYKKKGQFKVKIAKRLNPDLSFHIPSPDKKPTKQRNPASSVSIPSTPAELANFSPTAFLVHVIDDHLSLYDCSTGGYLTKFAVPPEITCMSSVLMLPSGSVFISGRAAPISAFAFEICIKTGSILKLSNMLLPRYGHGTIFSNGSIYVFGGTSWQGLISNCEALEMDSKQWRRLASLRKARDFFNPCLYEQFVFIIGGRKTTICEQYSIPENTFTLLPFRVPAGGQCTSLIISNSILYLHNKQIVKFSLKSMKLEWTTIRPTPPSLAWSVLNPVLLGNTLYFVKSHVNGMKKVELPAEALE